MLHRGLSGTHIAILGENSTEWCLSYFAVVNSGNVAVPLDRDLPEEELAELLCRCDCTALITSGKYKARAEAFRARDDLGQIEYINLEDFESWVEAGQGLIRDGDTVLVKASHSMRFEEITAALEALK